MSAKCPGAQSFNQPRPEDVKCPHCKGELEIWSDEFKATCPHCRKIVIRDMELSCVEWFRYAKDCVGDQAYGRYMRKRADTLKQRLLKELE
ncbi:MAG: hypothetical protein ABH825_02755, partial [Candidatus Omnitrophota bacterium]